VSFWPAMSLLAGACGAGYIHLLLLFLRNRGDIETLKVEMSYKICSKDVSNEFVRKETHELHVRLIEKDVKLILEKINLLMERKDE
jgi:hypothetical protein